MAYSVTTNDGVTISVADEAKDSSSLSLTVIGRNATNYGQTILTNTVRQLENFAGNVPPTPTYLLTGQLWYNKSENTLRVYNGTTWSRVSAVPVSATEISSNVTTGTAYFNSTDDKLKVYDGSTFRDAVLPGGTVTAAYAGNVSASGNATNYGAKVETLFLQAANVTPSIVPVVAVKYVSDATSGYEGELADDAHDSANATVMAIFSDRAFALDPSDPYYSTLSNANSFGATFTKGMNLRADYTDASVAQADTSEWADKANAIYTGSTIPAADIIHVGSTNWTPSGTVSSNYTLGNSTNRFGNFHVDQIQLGNPTTPKTVGIVGTVNIGNSSSEVNQIFVHDLTVSGNLDFDGINDILNLENADIDNVTLTTGTISTTPSNGTDIANKSYVDAQASAATATEVTLVPTNTSTSTHYPLFASAASGNEESRTDSDLTYVPTSGTLTTAVISATTVGATTGTFTGTVTGGTVTDGTLDISGGAITSGVSASFSGTVTANLFSGTATQARYADLAEKYTADADYEPGTVVKIGGEAEITQTTSHADTEVFGVISTDPAYLMNKDIDGLPVALQGRVPVKVIGKVKKGERLISSDVPGVAWGVADENVPLQAIIGRALEDKTDGNQGVVEAVIGVK